jgi:hypothetical protein
MIQKSHEARKKAKQLLEKAKREVEEWMKDKNKSIHFIQRFKKELVK